MSYRETDVVQASPEILDVPSTVAIQIMNGLASEIAIPCTYVIPAVAPATVETYDPIHLTAEGYGAPDVAFAGAPAGLTGTAWIDESDDSIVRLVLSAQCPTAVSSDLECEISVLATRDAAPHGTRTDCILRGTVTVIAAPLPSV